MRKKSFVFVVLLAFVCMVPQRAFANMAAPEDADVGSAITFEKNDEIAVLSEDLEIVVKGPDAHITATYEMKNTTDEALSISSMFLSPNMEAVSYTHLDVYKRQGMYYPAKDILFYSADVHSMEMNLSLIHI